MALELPERALIGLLILILGLTILPRLLRPRRFALPRPVGRPRWLHGLIEPYLATPKLPYTAARSLLSEGELAFYRVLSEAVADEFVISIKPRLADLLRCSPSAWRQGYGRLIAQKHVDFVLLDPETLAVVVAVELDDRSHRRRDRRARDAFVDEVMATIGTPMVRVQATTGYDASFLRGLLPDPI